MTAEKLITEEVRLRIEEAIANAEQNTSAEIRVHVEDKFRTKFRKLGANFSYTLLDKAAYIFEQLEMHKTEARNGVLIYVSIEDKKAAIIGDVGINTLVDAHFWKDVLQTMTTTISAQGVEHGLIEAIQNVGQKIKLLFPIVASDKNELPNTVSIGNRNLSKKK